MIARFFTLLPLALFVSATHLEARDQCNGGTVSCCNSMQTVDQAGPLLASFGLASVAAGVTGLVGLSCTSVPVLGTGSSCTSQTVCCAQNEFNGLVNIGCSPINVDA